MTTLETMRITSGGLTLGGPTCGSITVSGLEPAYMQDIGGMLTLLATRDDARVNIVQMPSTFRRLAIQADNGIGFDHGLNILDAGILIEGDHDNSAADDVPNSIEFGGGSMMNVRDVLTLKSNTGTIIRNGDLTLRAGLGIALYSHLNSTAVGSKLTFYSGRCRLLIL